MKLIYIGKNLFSNRYKSLFKSRGVEYIIYQNPLKAMDNFKEISPDIVLMELDDFPRFWKIVLKAVKEESNGKISFLLSGKLNDKELKAFNFLKGDKLLQLDEDGVKSLKDFIICNKTEEIYFPEVNDIAIGFIDPKSFSFINGFAGSISLEKLTFIPESPEDIENLGLNDIIENVSINIDENMSELDLKIIDISDKITFQIVSCSEIFKDLLTSLFV